MENLLRKYQMIDVAKGSILKTIKNLKNNLNGADKIQKAPVKLICVTIDNFLYYCFYNNLEVALNEFVIGKIRYYFGYHSNTESVNNFRSTLHYIVPLHKSFFSINEIKESSNIEVLHYRSNGTPSTLKFLN